MKADEGSRLRADCGAEVVVVASCPDEPVVTATCSCGCEFLPLEGRRSAGAPRLSGARSGDEQRIP